MLKRGKPARFFTRVLLHVLKGLALVAFWPIVCFCNLFWNKGCYLTSYGKNRIERRKLFNESTIVASRAQISEVCSEATFEPLLQLYLLMPTLTCFNYSKLLETNLSDFSKEVPKLQFWSVMTSCLALAWSFNSYQATTMNGALDFSSNITGRLVHLASCVCQISSRLVILVIFAYTWGEGNLWPMMMFAIIHMLAMAFIHWRTMYRPPNWTRRSVFYQCIINGISNLYLHNDIVARKCEDRMFNQNLGTRDTKLFLVNGIIFVENIIVVLIALFHPSEIGIPTGLLVSVIVVHTLGLILMLVYYQHFHIWSSLIPFRVPFKQAK